MPHSSLPHCVCVCVCEDEGEDDGPVYESDGLCTPLSVQPAGQPGSGGDGHAVHQPAGLPHGTSGGGGSLLPGPPHSNQHPQPTWLGQGPAGGRAQAQPQPSGRTLHEDTGGGGFAEAGGPEPGLPVSAHDQHQQQPLHHGHHREEDLPSGGATPALAAA